MPRSARAPTPASPAVVEPGEKVTWRLRGLAMLSALLYPLSQSFVWPGDMSMETLPHAWTGYLAFVCLVPILLAVRKLPPLKSYLLSAWFLVPGTCLLLYWLMVAMVVYGHIPVWGSLALLAMLGAAGWQFMGLAVGVGRILEQRFRLAPALAIPVAWTGMEYCRAYVYFGGFPWGNLGASQSSNLPFLQLGSLGGVYLIIFVLAFSNAVFSETVRALVFKERAFPRSLLLGLGAVLAFSYGFGTWRIHEVDAVAAQASKVTVGMLQGNVEQGIKNEDHLYADDILRKYDAVQKQALMKGAELIIWPEAAYPGGLDKADTTLANKRFPSLGQAAGVIGASVYWRDPPTLTGEPCRNKPAPRECRGKAYLHNSALVVNPDLTVVGRFDKTHLVPFGEYVPWPLGAIAKAIVPALGSSVPGDSFTPVEITALPQRPKVAALICYEGIFPQYARKFAEAGAELIINVTNDAWYGVSSAAPQHLGFYALRAAETGRAIARVANTGITAGVDPVGRILNPSVPYADTAVVMDLPLMREQTLYTRVGDVVGWVCLLPFATALCYGLARWYTERKRRKQAPAR